MTSDGEEGGVAEQPPVLAERAHRSHLELHQIVCSLDARS